MQRAQAAAVAKRLGCQSQSSRYVYAKISLMCPQLLMMVFDPLVFGAWEALMCILIIFVDLILNPAAGLFLFKCYDECDLKHIYALI